MTRVVKDMKLTCSLSTVHLANPVCFNRMQIATETCTCKSLFWWKRNKGSSPRVFS